MRRWLRTSELGGGVGTRDERWRLDDGDGVTLADLRVEVTAGKPLDVLALKGTDLGEVRDYAAHLCVSASSLYGGDRRSIGACPCCGRPTGDAERMLAVNGVAYHRCRECGHGFVLDQPTRAALELHFAGSDEHAATYTDPAAVEVRLAQVVRPKVDWSTGVYRRTYGRPPASAVDVGAGGGHFVEGLRRAGVDGVGYELSDASRAFARDAFGIDLRAADFLSDRDGERVDLVTFWGLLEYTPEPRRFLAAARRRLSGEGLLVVEVPRLDCVGTAVQAQPGALIARHLDPTSHVNCFSDASLATALVEEGFLPVAAWVFGMDAYELATQLALRLGDGVFDTLVEALLPLQPAFDAGLLADDLVVAAIPA